MSSRRFAWLAIALSTAAFADLAGCGGSKPEPKPPTAAPAPMPTPGTPAPPPTAEAPTQAPAGGPMRMNSSAEAAYRRGLSAYASGDLPTAKSAFQEAISADSKAFQAHYSLGVVLERMGDSNASSEYRQSFTIQPDYEQGILAYALYIATHGSLTEAEGFVNGKRGQFPNSAGVIAALAEIKSMQRDTTSAQQLAQEALKKNSDYRPAMVTIARDHYRNRRLDLSLYALQAILDGFGEDNPPRDKDNADAHFLRGIILKEEGRRAAAIGEFKQAVAGRPDLVAARVELAAYYLEAGNASESQPLLEGALRFDPNNVIGHLNLGDTYRLQGRIPEAKQQFDWVLSHDTSLAQVHYDLALLYLFAPNVPGMDQKRQTDEAIVEITKYQQMRGKLAAGQSDDSEELLNRAKQKLADLQAQQSAKEPVAGPATTGSAKAPPPPPPKPGGK